MQIDDVVKERGIMGSCLWKPIGCESDRNVHRRGDVEFWVWTFVGNVRGDLTQMNPSQKGFTAFRNDGEQSDRSFTLSGVFFFVWPGVSPPAQLNQAGQTEDTSPALHTDRPVYEAVTRSQPTWERRHQRSGCPGSRFLFNQRSPGRRSCRPWHFDWMFSIHTQNSP